MGLKKIADYLSKQLMAEGIVIQRYDAYSTNSIYLKLDYGVCNSIRISDHLGKKHLKYRYNIGPFVKEFRKEKDIFDRYYYRADKSQKLIKRILRDRNNKINKYGWRTYMIFMEKNKADGSGKQGFWNNAYLVKEDI